MSKTKVDPYYEVHVKMNGIGWMIAGYRDKEDAEKEGHPDVKTAAESWAEYLVTTDANITDVRLKRRTTVDPIVL